MSTEQKNYLYMCRQEHRTFAVKIHDGSAPHSIKCQQCDMYAQRVDTELAADIINARSGILITCELYRPTAEEIDAAIPDKNNNLASAAISYLESGGLWSRHIALPQETGEGSFPVIDGDWKYHLNPTLDTLAITIGQEGTFLYCDIAKCRKSKILTERYANSFAMVVNAPKMFEVLKKISDHSQPSLHEYYPELNNLLQIIELDGKVLAVKIEENL
jgi:hypothetical protein